MYGIIIPALWKRRYHVRRPMGRGGRISEVLSCPGKKETTGKIPKMGIYTYNADLAIYQI
jgi:hypothetical protein